MKIKNFYLVTFAVISFSMAAEELKWGVSLGYEKIDYGVTLENTDPGTSSSDIVLANTVKKGSMSYGALALGFDMKYGNHSFSVKSANGDSDDLMPGTDFPFTGWSHTDTNDRSETSFNYSYKLNNNWSVALGLYEGENEMEFTNNRTIDSAVNSAIVWSDQEKGVQDSTSEGAYLAAVYQNQISNKLFWYGKMAYQESTFDISQNYVYGETATASQAWLDAGYTQADLIGFLPGDTGVYEWDIVYEVETDGSAAVLGLGLVYVLSPTDTITLGYERKNYSYDAGEVTTYTYAGKSVGNLDNVGSVDGATTGTTFDEEADYITLTYRHQF
tara:strand:+ start:1259 stop:2248 length:990 start_codon:yes stop_codon:yes gene_type:complete